MKQQMTRRRFMHGVATTAGALIAGPYIIKAADLSTQKLRIAFIGTGGQGKAHIPWSTKEACPCYCDVDSKNWTTKDNKGIAQLVPNAKPYQDYREMFDKHMKEIDAVCIAIPDHSHTAASLLAIRNGKHCYTEKPLTWSVTEARTLAEEATKYKVATQMGNMGHANEGNRRVVEWIRAGLIGDVTEVHTWTNRPVWPQGIKERPPVIPVPESLNWDCWIGPGPFREYHDGLHQFKWRGWFDFGCGAVGDMGCHTWDCVFWSLAPDYPTTVELVKIVDRTKETYPTKSQTRWTFPAKGNRPGFVAYWYEGGLKPAVPEEMMNDPYWQTKPKKAAAPAAAAADAAPTATDPAVPAKPELGHAELPASGSIFIGTKGKLLVAGDYGNSPRLIPESFHKGATFPDKSIPSSPGHHEEWVMASKGEKPLDFPGSNFPGYAGPLTEVMLLAAMAIKLGEVGGKIECDPVKREIKTAEALALVHREYRKGWSM